MPNIKIRNKSTEPPCKKKETEKKTELDCYKLFRKIVSGKFKVDDSTIEIISRCDQPDYEYVMGKNIGK